MKQNTRVIFYGYYVAPPGMLREIRIEAKRISASIAGKENVMIDTFVSQI